MAGAVRAEIRIPVELLFAAGMGLFALGLSLWGGVAFVAPTAQSAAAVGVHYFFPLFAIIAWLACAAMFGRQTRLLPTLTTLGCYAFVMWLHFNIKLWAHHLNGTLHDRLFWQTDQAVRPLIDWCIATTTALRGLSPWIDMLYMIGFIALFFLSFCVHAVRSQEVFRKVFLAAIFIQGLGAIAYLVMPALGPFLYEPGAIPQIGKAQAHMLALHREAMAMGPAWVGAAGRPHLLTGLAAMPSLHAGGSFVFLYFVARYERPMLLLYGPLFAFILIAAIGTRWHYAIDLPVGIALAAACIALAYRLDSFAIRLALPIWRSPAKAPA